MLTKCHHNTQFQFYADFILQQIPQSLILQHEVIHFCDLRPVLYLLLVRANVNMENQSIIVFNLSQPLLEFFGSQVPFPRELTT